MPHHALQRRLPAHMTSHTQLQCLHLHQQELQIMTNVMRDADIMQTEVAKPIAGAHFPAGASALQLQHALQVVCIQEHA